jgi:general secretion pathway protein G
MNLSRRARNASSRPGVGAVRRAGFTLIELIVVMAIIGVLLSLSLPRYFQSVDRSAEVTLRHNLNTMREAIDKFHGDNGRWPRSLQELVERRYLRALPVDSITGQADTWIAVPPPADASGETTGVRDVRSGASGNAADGAPYSQW